MQQRLGLRHPIVLGPFGGLSSVNLTAAVAEAGGLGSFGLYGYSADRIRETADELRRRTSGPIALNLWLPWVGPGERPLGEPTDRQTYDDAAEALRTLYAEAGAEPPPYAERLLPAFEEQVEAALDARPAALSFVFGVPPTEIVSAAHERGILVIGAATTVPEALALEAGGVDAIVASGFEAAGHRPSFLLPAEKSLVGGLALIPQVVDAVDVPVIAAGGIADRRGVAAALALGAEAVQVGTAFLATEESAAPHSHRDSIRSSDAHETVLTRAMSGRFARGLPNHAVRVVEESDAIAPFPLQNVLTGAFRRAAAAADRPDLLSLWMGQGAALARGATAAEVMAELVAGVATHR
ncbi:nitronate monooxygenase [Leifsonia sp. F6_8S_P_1B]|uniref:Propionate 3-nitronate monooxygenase n=1 Tax=Leifsonia williamsii TaxID=3035919 RepID=A0ABT8KE97_9MICO|nr:nitronate monooxygenase [Leifsonia williamsii]MDN4615776.1 nitronate monooxygenase [Leifsonia williamsii]